MFTLPLRPIALALAVSLGLGAAAHAGAAGKVAVMSSPSPALAQGATYAWAPLSGAAVVTPDPALANVIVAERLRAAIDAAMTARGYRQVADRSQAQLLVAYNVVLQQRSETRVSERGGGRACGWRGCVGGWPSDFDVKRISYTQGTLVLDLIDNRAGRLVWRAASAKRIDQKDVTQARLNAVVADMTKSLPPI